MRHLAAFLLTLLAVQSTAFSDAKSIFDDDWKSDTPQQVEPPAQVTPTPNPAPSAIPTPAPAHRPSDSPVPASPALQRLLLQPPDSRCRRLPLN